MTSIIPKAKALPESPVMMDYCCLKCAYFKLWYGLSDYEVEDAVNDRISFSYFCGLTTDQIAPYHSTISRFRTALTKADTYHPLFKLINSQLKAHQIIVVKGAIVDTADLPQEITLKADKVSSIIYLKNKKLHKKTKESHS